MKNTSWGKIQISSTQYWRQTFRFCGFYKQFSRCNYFPFNPLIYTGHYIIYHINITNSPKSLVSPNTNWIPGKESNYMGQLISRSERMLAYPKYTHSPLSAFFRRWLACVSEKNNVFASSQSACTNFRAAPVGDRYQRGFKIYLAFASWCDSVPLISHLISHFTWGRTGGRAARGRIRTFGMSLGMREQQQRAPMCAEAL